MRGRPSTLMKRVGRPWMSSGTADAIAAPRTAGRARSFASSMAAKRRMPASSTGRPVRSYSASSTPSRTNPGSTPRVALKFRKNSPATSNTTTASATSVAIRMFRTRLRGSVFELARRCCGATRASCSAGARPKTHRAGDAEQHRDRQARSIDGGLERDGNPSHAHLRQRIQRPRSPNRHAGAERRATQGEHEAFGQEQLRDAPRLRAERQANRHFLAPGARPRQQQIGGVAADRKQQQERDALEDDERGGEETLRTAWRPPERQHVRLHGGVGLRERSRQLPHDAGDFVLRTCLARVRREPTDDRVAANRSVFQLTRPGEEQR